MTIVEILYTTYLVFSLFAIYILAKFLYSIKNGGDEKILVFTPNRKNMVKFFILCMAVVGIIFYTILIFSPMEFSITLYIAFVITTAFVYFIFTFVGYFGIKIVKDSQFY